MSVELEPCPFCGSDGDELGLCYDVGQTPRQGRDWFVRCYVCHVETAREDESDEAIAAWNRRVQPVSDPYKFTPSLEEVEAVARIIEENVWARLEVNDGVNCFIYSGIDEAARAILALRGQTGTKGSSSEVVDGK